MLVKQPFTMPIHRVAGIDHGSKRVVTMKTNQNMTLTFTADSTTKYMILTLMFLGPRLRVLGGAAAG